MSIRKNNRATTGYKADIKANPSWLAEWLEQLPPSYRFALYDVLKKQAARHGYGNNSEGIKKMLIEEVSRDIRREALRLYGKDHPNAKYDYKWSPPIK
jgi:Mg/Co/Ni transporter MgtE